MESGVLVHDPTPCNYEEVLDFPVKVLPFVGSEGPGPGPSPERKQDFLLSFQHSVLLGRPRTCMSPHMASDAVSFRAEQMLLFNNCIYLFQLNLFKEEY